MTQILFVCSANRYRSVIAEACFRDEALKRDQGDRWTILSAGTWTTDGLPAMTEAILGAKQIGLDIQKHRSRAITKEILQSADLVLVMEKGQQEALQIEFPFCRKKTMLLSEAAEGRQYDISDPMAHSSNNDVVSKICDLIHSGFDRICDLARH